MPRQSRGTAVAMPAAVFVFGSNLAGRHGKGAALCALREHGAVYGQGEGPQGSSYAIPTKGFHLEVLPLEMIARYVRLFLAYAREHEGVEFLVTRVGCGLAGYSDEEVAPLFYGAPANCAMPDEWVRWL